MELDPQPDPARAPRLHKLRAALRARARVVLAAVTFVVPLLTVLVAVSEWNGIPGQPLRDTSAYYLAAQAARTGSDIYDPLPPPGPHEFQGQRYYLYPPPLAAFLSFFPDVSLTAFDRIWLCLNITAFWIYAACLARIADRKWGWRSTLRWGAAAFFLPGAWLGIHFGNIEMMILALVALGLTRSRVAGACLVLAAVFKVTPVWALAVRVIRLPRRTLGSAVAGVLACIAACFAVLGPEETVALSLRWIRDVMPAPSQGQFWGGSLPMLLSDLHPIHYNSNLSVSFLPVQVAVLTGWPYEGGDLPGYVRHYLTAVALLGPLAAAWFTRRRSATLQAAVVFAAALFSAPIVRPYVLPVLLLVLAAARSERERDPITDPPP